MATLVNIWRSNVNVGKAYGRLGVLATTKYSNEVVVAKDEPEDKYSSMSWRLDAQEAVYLRPHMIGTTRHFESLWMLPTKGKWSRTRYGEMVIDDLMIRKVVRGTFPLSDATPIIIKRKENTIRVVFHISRFLDKRMVYYLMGFTSTLLSEILACRVHVLPHSVIGRSPSRFKTPFNTRE